MDMPRLKVTLSIGFANARHMGILEIDEQDWADCETPEQKEDLIEEYWTDWSSNYIDGSAEIIEGQN